MTLGPSPIVIGEFAVCAFAAYGTLFDMVATVGRARDRLGEQTRELARLWRVHQQRLLSDDSMPSSLREFWHKTGQALDAAMADLGIKDALLRARLMQLALNADAFADARAAMESLRGLGIKVAVFSNATLTMLISALKHTGLDRFTDATVPADPLAFKPTPSAYAFLCKTLRQDPVNIVYVSADPADAESAARAGLKAIWVRRDTSENSAAKSAMATISSLAELPPLLSRG